VSLSASPEGPVVQETRPRGDHVADSERSAMQAAFAVAGPGVATGSDLGPIRQIDIAPTLAALLGIGPPRQAVGRVLERVLAYPIPPPAAEAPTGN
jgi:hypothetical protein